MKTLPLGTAYTIWTDIGAVGAFVLGIAVLGEPVTPARIIAAVLIVSGLFPIEGQHDVPADRQWQKGNRLNASLYTWLRIRSVSFFEKTLVSCALQTDAAENQLPRAHRLNRFWFSPDASAI